MNPGKDRKHHPLFRALFRLQSAYEVRDGHTEDSSITILIENPQGRRWPVQLSQHAADDLALTIEDLGHKRREENRDSGALLQSCGDSNTGQIIISLARGIATTEPDQLQRRQRMVRHQFEKAAASTDQPDVNS